MKKIILTSIVLTMAISVYCQMLKPNPELNLDFEKAENGFPIGWNIFGASNYSASLDTTMVKSGSHSASIQSKEGETGFKAWGFTLPSNYAGKIIKLTGFIKTENVTDGYAGLWMRIDPSIAFDNMNKNGIKGTTEWTKYEVSLNMKPEKTDQIVVGGLLVGRGKMWLDQLEITVDGIPIDALKPYERKIFPAEKDNEFDLGSKVTIETLSNNQKENLKILGLVWGFLKYYHPNIARGDYNWDYELFRIIPKVLAAENNKGRDDVLVKWINNLGSFLDGKEMTEMGDIKYKPDLDWIKTAGLSGELTSQLNRVKNANRPKEHYYIALHPNVGNPDFKNEKEYLRNVYPDVGFRLLSLFRYWNMIQYYFPYKNLIDEDWKKTLESFIPKMVDAKNETEYTTIVLELIARVHDTHANIWGGNPVLAKYFGEKYAAVELSFVENKAVVTGFNDKKLGSETGLEMGDVILSVNNRLVAEIVKELLIRIPASNYPTQLRDIAPNLLRTNDSTITIEFLRNNKKESKILKTFSTKQINIYRRFEYTDTSFKLINKDIAYLNNGAVKRKDLSKIWNDIKNTKGLIIDDRNYPSDFVIYELSNYLLPNSTPFVKFSNGSIEYPGLFTFTKPLNAGKNNIDSYKGKIVVIVNEISQSSAEFHAMAYRVNPNTTVIGSTTAGADGNISQIVLPGGIRTAISGIGVYYPDGKETQRVGIVPNIEVKPTIEGIKAGRDELMEKAIEIINR